MLRNTSTGEVRWFSGGAATLPLQSGWVVNTVIKARTVADGTVTTRDRRQFGFVDRDGSVNQTPAPPPSGQTQGNNLLGSTVLWRSPDGIFTIEFGTYRQDIGALRQSGFRGSFPTLQQLQAGDSSALKGLTRRLNYWWNTEEEGTDTQQRADDDLFSKIGDETTGPGSGRGRGSGPIAPIYNPRDRVEVEESLKGYLVAVNGRLDGNLLAEAADKYMAVDRANFDNDTQINAFLAAQNLIRASSAYKDIHELRPESSDEMEWVTSQQGLLRQLGVSDLVSEDLGIDLARVGASVEGAKQAGQKAFTRSSGRIHRDQREVLKAAGRAAMGLV
jgi:hypothetical protein